ncbi:MAG: outer membrane beta-barrel protein [Caulobacteraceae bacterium]|nr:outer membrane beta-barrel protein [Caulobacteraceae bacterium]
MTTAYDSNVARSSAALAAARGVKQQDFYVLPSANALFSEVFGRETVFLDAAFGYKAYARNSFLDRDNIKLGAGAVGQFSLCQGTFAGAYDRSQADLSTLPISVGGTRPVLAAKDTQTNAVVDFTAICGRSIGFAPTANVSEVWVTNSSPSFQAIDAHIFSGSGGITYRNPVLGSATIDGQYSKVDYPNRFVPFGSMTTGFGFQTMGGGVTLARTVGSRLSGSLSVNYTRLEPNTAFTQGFSGITYDANIAYALNPRLTLTLVAGRGVTPSNEIEATFLITEIYGMEAAYALGDRLSISAGYSRTHENYEGILFPVAFILTEQTINGFYTNANFRLNRHISLRPAISYSQRTANFTPYNYNDVTVSMTAHTTF